jgi:hypothetical protein
VTARSLRHRISVPAATSHTPAPFGPGRWTPAVARRARTQRLTRGLGVRRGPRLSGS